MDKKEQIQGLLKEWREEDSDKRIYRHGNDSSRE